MKHLDLTLPTPAENLACDEALLDAAENGESGECLRFWEARDHFVVVGYANSVNTEVNVAAYEARRIPVFRRCSGGGTVLQGPGCLNYALVLSISDDGPLRNITAANRFIMERNRDAIQSAIGDRRSEIQAQGHTDLAIAGRKFSGNSQRRRKSFLLFHGTFLLNFDLALVGELLPMPSKQPDYRAGRTHERFLTNLNAPSEIIKATMRRAWDGKSSREAIHVPPTLVEKYLSSDWNNKF
jgi:lipoate-protein ligase A